MPCLFHNTERGFGGKPPQKSRFRRHLAGSKTPEEGSKMPKETFFTATSRWRVVSPRSMPRVFGRGSRSQPAALVSNRDDAALVPAIRILERDGSAKSGRARRVRTACRRRGDSKRSSTICCRSFGLRAVLQKPDRAEFGIAAEDRAHDLRLAVHDNEFAVLCPITERRHSAHPARAARPLSNGRSP